MSEGKKKYLDYRVDSKRTYRGLAHKNDAGHDILTEDQIKLGAILRIADAVEKMADNFDHIVYQREMYRKKYDNQRAISTKLKKENRELKQLVKELKNQIKS